MAELRTKVKSLMRFVFSRLVVTGVLLLLQAVWLFILFNKLAEYAGWINVVGVVISVVMCAALIRKDSTVPEFKISWLALFILMPVQGGLLYLWWGDHRPALRLRRKLARAALRIRPLRTPEPAGHARLAAADPRAAATAAYLENYGGFPVYGDTRVTYYPSGEEMFPAMLEAMEKAERYIFVEFFIISQGRMWDTVHELLRRKAAAGVDVRLIYDDTGCVTGLPVRYWRKLEAEGIRALSFNPFVPMINLVMNNGTTARSWWWTARWPSPAASTWRTSTSTKSSASATGGTPACGWKARRPGALPRCSWNSGPPTAPKATSGRCPGRCLRPPPPGRPGWCSPSATRRWTTRPSPRTFTWNSSTRPSGNCSSPPPT